MNDLEINDFILKNYLSLPVKTIARRIGRSSTLVYGRMKKMNLVIPADIVEQRKKDSQFKKGDISFNKGKRLHEFMSAEAIEKIKKTQFKKGQLPHNTKYDGCLSLRYSHSTPYWWIRISVSNWQLLHRVIWEKQFGEIPEGCNVQFKDGNSRNVDPENLYLINRSDQAIVNKSGGNSLPFKLRKSIELVNRLNKKINEK